MRESLRLPTAVFSTAAPPRHPTPRIYFGASARRKLAKLFGRRGGAAPSAWTAVAPHSPTSMADGPTTPYECVGRRVVVRSEFARPHQRRGGKCAARLARTARRGGEKDAIRTTRRPPS